MYLALQVDRKAEICSGRKYNRSTAYSSSRFNGAVDSLRIQCLAVARGAVHTHVESALGGAGYSAGSLLRRVGEGSQWHRASYGSEAASAQQIPTY